jgi:hypothetical protein
MIVYLAGPIDLVDGEQRNAWRERFSGELQNMGISTFNPAAAFGYVPASREDAQTLIDINKRAMLFCDFTVIVMGRSMPSIGTPIELYMLHQARKPHVVVWEPSIDSFGSEKIGKRVAHPPLPAYVQGLADKVVHRFGDAIGCVLDYRDKLRFIASEEIIGIDAMR